jgi:hypothetical protein
MSGFKKKKKRKKKKKKKKKKKFLGNTQVKSCWFTNALVP